MKRNLCYPCHCAEYDKLPDALRHLAADWRTVPPDQCEMCHTYCSLCDRDTPHDDLGDGWVRCRACGCKQTVRKEAEHVPSM